MVSYSAYAWNIMHNSSLLEKISYLQTILNYHTSSFISTAVDDESYTTSCPDSLSGVGNVAGAKMQYDISNGVLCARK